ncbi:glycyl-tRNA synthetase, beta subunit [Reticulomyxa filosa]|uniref:glycine--tRNA ligase n=1 Tax=Reticulomyxa filosa TaxID=46433 RepID=X6LLR0_RETFI|nr:glycyl-tRNA synthetase, beta subunit [Reticulomyxa filosa]|eukprot:ETO02559.1 glycyl-tRNA synthetase, beta subunit [Reticulomyxa filosa]
MHSTLKLGLKLADMLKLDPVKIKRAIELMKCDLVTEMVGEFPELQGIMGYYYSLNDSEDEGVAIAIRDHYKPLGPNDSTPNSPTAAAVALSDKLDTLNQMFSINIKPTGSKDPFALRRAANGIIRIIKENNLMINLAQDLAKLGIREDVINFILERDAIN